MSVPEPTPDDLPFSKAKMLPAKKEPVRRRPVARRKGDPGKADELFKRIIHARGRCERCGKPGHDTAHIVKRRFRATRCLEDNAWFLCRSCHNWTEIFPLEFLALVKRTIGLDRYEQLCELAQRKDKTSSQTFWRAEVERLAVRCKELGIETRRRA